MDNAKIAEVFEEIADMMDINGENFFKINAYRKAVQIIQNYPKDFRQVVERERDLLKQIPGIGQALREKIIELVETGKCQEHEKLKANFPRGLLEILRLRGVGPKKVKLFYSTLGITNVKELKDAAEAGKLSKLDGMGEKSENDILRAIAEMATFSSDRRRINEALQEAERLIEHMKKCPEIEEIQYAGSLRRWQETIGDIDILTTVKGEILSTSSLVMKHFAAYDENIETLSEGETKSGILLRSGIKVDLRVVDSKCFGAALHYFTGSKEHNIRIRDIAKKMGLKVSEYGVFKEEDFISGKTETEIFKAVGLPYIIPEIRKDDGEIEYGLKHGKFPEFIELGEIRGDLHCHSVYSDGENTIAEMAEGFIARGYEYFAITDHSSLIPITNGMGSKEIRTQWEEVDSLNKKFSGRIKILKGCEVDILKDGSLDFGDEVLKNLDIVIISAHTYQRLDEEEQTTRIIRAIENPYTRILAHPTGRMINERVEMKFDMEKVIEACVQNNVALEINSQPSRLDLTDKYVRIARSKGAKFVIDTDSHSLANQEFMKFGVGIARRGWLTKDEVLNSMTLASLTAHFAKV